MFFSLLRGLPDMRILDYAQAIREADPLHDPAIIPQLFDVGEVAFGGATNSHSFTMGFH